MEILLANPRGFCAGVDRAIEIVERALELFGKPVYVRHEVVHNKFVVEDLTARGAVFVEELDDIPPRATVVFSAHGVSQAVRKEADSRDLHVFDATCPLVTKVHMEIARYAREGRETILIGHAGHPEVEGSMGQYDTSLGGAIYLVENLADAQNLQVKNPDHLALVTQTTLSVDDTKGIIEVLKRRFPDIVTPRKDDICYATQNRQDAVKRLAETCDLVLVVGSRNSSNSTRLAELAAKRDVEAYLIDSADEIADAWLRGKKRIGVTAGASAPEALVRQVVDKLQQMGATAPREYEGIQEKVVFALPKALRTGALPAIVDGQSG